MTRSQMVSVVAMILLAAFLSFPVDAATKYNPCSLLTAAELETALHGKADRSGERDTTIADGPFKGEIMSTCDWLLGSGSASATLTVIRGPKNPQEQAAGVASLRAAEAKLKQKGWTVEPANISGADCVSLKPPASEPTALPGSSCAMVSKGLAFWLGVNGKEPPTVQQVKALADKVAARL